MYQFFERFALFWHFHKTYKLFVKAIFIMLISIHLVLFRHPINGWIDPTPAHAAHVPARLQAAWAGVG